MIPPPTRRICTSCGLPYQVRDSVEALSASPICPPCRIGRAPAPLTMRYDSHLAVDPVPAPVPDAQTVELAYVDSSSPRFKLDERFTCDGCKRSFVKARPDIEAYREMVERFGHGEDPTRAAVVCEDCLEILEPYLNPRQEVRP